MYIECLLDCKYFSLFIWASHRVIVTQQVELHTLYLEVWRKKYSLGHERKNISPPLSLCQANISTTTAAVTLNLQTPVSWTLCVWRAPHPWEVRRDDNFLFS